MARADDRLHLFGIRHHGPGSASSVLAALEILQPDCVLIEGPPEADALIELAARDGMRPPLAILTWPVAEPERARFHPFAEYSPEWCAMRWAVAQGRPARFIDLPIAKDPSAEAPAAGANNEPTEVRGFDPLGRLAEAAGHADGEAWWDALVERATGAPEVFTAIGVAMSALRAEREAQAGSEDQQERRREAFMRQQIRAALQEFGGPVAVVCGAWHVPAMTPDATTVAADRAILKGYGKATRVEACWVPWTEPRLARASGYGAGVVAPGWYAHLWREFQAGRMPRSVASVAAWQGRVARALREAGHPAATSSVIDATRLALSLAAVRCHAVPGLGEMRDATLAALCHGEEALLRVVEDRLVVGHGVGEVAEGVPQPPLQLDLQRWQKRLRMKPSAEPCEAAFDLRTDTGRAKSALLWRLTLLEVPWGELAHAAAGRGTWREVWKLCWQPELAVRLAEAVVHGATIEQAAARAAVERAARVQAPLELAGLVKQALLADLPTAAERSIAALQELAARAQCDLLGLMPAVPPLVDVLRYGSARELATDPLRQLVEGIVVEVGVGLGLACRGRDDQQAAQLSGRLDDFDRAVTLLDGPVQTEQWCAGLEVLATDDAAAGRLRGRATRLLHDRGVTAIDETAARLSRALSPSQPLATAGEWLEGFLAGGGDVLLHDTQLLASVDRWLMSPGAEPFLELLPMLRRAFVAFDATERRRLFAQLRKGPRDAAPTQASADDPRSLAAFAAALPLLRTILDLPADPEARR